MAHARPLLTLAILALITFWPLVLHPTETLYSDSSDLLAEHLPAKLFLVRSLRETGELPLWNPEQYAGSPFVHDIQVGLFYPPHVPLYFISESAVGPFLSWLVFAHVLLAGCLMYAYARHAGMGELAAFTAGVGFMLSPRWMMQLFLAGHTVTQGICWIPLVILCVERSIQRRSWRWAIGGSVAYALFVLGTHPQWTFYGSLLIGLWPLRLASRERQRPVSTESPASLKEDYGDLPPSPPGFAGGEGRGEGGQGSLSQNAALIGGRPQPASPPAPLTPRRGERGEEPRARTILFRWLLAEAIVVVIGLGLCAVQLLPTIEAAGESSRAHGMGQSWSLDGAKAAATTLIGPIPDKRAEPIHWETRGGIGFTWAIMAIVGARLGGRRTLVPTLIAVGMLAYALGGSYFIDRLPGFNNFRMPTRMLLTLAFPVAYLAGIGVQSLSHERAKSILRMATAFWMIVLANIFTIHFLSGNLRRTMIGAEPWCLGYWFTIVAGWSVFLLLQPRLSDRSRSVCGTIIMAIDVMFIVFHYPDIRPLAEIYPKSPIIDYIREHNPDGHRVYDIPAMNYPSLLGPGSPAASVHGVPSILGFNPLDVARYRRFLAFTAGIDETNQAFTSKYSHPVVLPDQFENESLLSLLGVRYVILFKVMSTREPPGTTRGVLRIDSKSWPSRADDMAPRCFDFLGGGVRSILPVGLFESPSPCPRSFVVSTVQSQAPESGILNQLRATDLRAAAALEDWNPTTDPLPSGNPRPARIRSHSPNRIAIALDGQTAGLLVLTDPWYPGWVCRIDGQETKIWKADYAFRGVMVPAGSREVVFHFEPQSYRHGKWISLATLAGIVMLLLFAIARRSRARGIVPS